MSVKRILEALDRHEPAALARAITLVENQRNGFERVLSHAHAQLGRGVARRVGITGPPGAGKSTLTERLIQHYRAQGLSVGVVAVDPTSPFTGGALLGDRIRMESASLDPHVFIRSMATRGAHGGLATTTEEVADLLEAFGFARILGEAVDDAAVRRVRERRRHESALPLPAGARPDGPVGGVRLPDADGLRLRSSAGRGRGRALRGRDLVARRHGGSVPRHPLDQVST